MKREERSCEFCGAVGVYAKGLCKKCYVRKLRNGTLEYKDRSGKRPERYSEITKTILQMRGDGIAQSDIARSLNVTRQNVSRVIKDYGPKTNLDLLVSDEEKLRNWYCDGRSCGNCDYCETAGCSLARWLHEEASE